MAVVLVTGGLGFIGSEVVRKLIKNRDHQVIVIDKLNYAANISSVKNVIESPKLEIIKEDICNSKAIEKILFDKAPNKILHLAAESHVDKSIDNPLEFLRNNIMGTFSMLEVTRKYISQSKNLNSDFIFHHVSTDEVYGDLGQSKKKFNENSRYEPSSPYSASKASSDHIVRAWGRTFKIPFIITNTSNNFGPFQHPEKLIPHVILTALNNRKIPIYGNGQQIRDWIYVEDHVNALLKVLFEGKDGETYNIGGNNEKTNLSVVKKICQVLNKKVPISNPYENLIHFVKDRPGHDIKYSIDSSKIMKNLGWHPKETFDSGIDKTVNWYLENKIWWDEILKNKYTFKRQG